MQNKEFCEKLAKCSNPAEIRDLFSSNGIEINEDQSKGLDYIIREMPKITGSLGEKELDEITGGSTDITGKTLLGSTAVGAAITLGGAMELISDFKNRKDWRHWIVDSGKAGLGVLLMAICAIKIKGHGGYENNITDLKQSIKRFF